MVTSAKEQIGLLVRVLVMYAAWLTMIFVELPFLASAVLVVASPFLFGGIVWHLRKRYSVSAVNRLNFPQHFASRLRRALKRLRGADASVTLRDL